MFVVYYRSSSTKKAIIYTLWLVDRCLELYVHVKMPQFRYGRNTLGLQMLHDVIIVELL